LRVVPLAEISAALTAVVVASGKPFVSVQAGEIEGKLLGDFATRAGRYVEPADRFIVVDLGATVTAITPCSAPRLTDGTSVIARRANIENAWEIGRRDGKKKIGSPHDNRPKPKK